MKKNNAFLDALDELQGGASVAELHRTFLQLIGSVRSLRKSGTLTLKLTVAMGKGENTNVIVLADEVTVKEPKPEREITLMFADNDNRLSRNDPRQPRLHNLDEPIPEKVDFRRVADIVRTAAPTTPAPTTTPPDNVDVRTGEIRE